MRRGCQCSVPASQIVTPVSRGRLSSTTTTPLVQKTKRLDTKTALHKNRQIFRRYDRWFTASNNKQVVHPKITEKNSIFALTAIRLQSKHLLICQQEQRGSLEKQQTSKSDGLEQTHLQNNDCDWLTTGLWFDSDVNCSTALTLCKCLSHNTVVGLQEI